MAVIRARDARLIRSWPSEKSVVPLSTGGRFARSVEALHQAVCPELTVKEALTKPGTSFPDSYDSDYRHLVFVTIGGSKGSTDYSLMVSVDNGRR